MVPDGVDGYALFRHLSQAHNFLIEKAFSILSTGQLTYEHPVRPIGSATKVTPSYDPYENTQGGKNSLTRYWSRN